MKQVFPKEILDNTVEVHQFKHRTRSKIIYCLILTAVVGALLSLPFLNVEVYTSARGIIKPNKNRITITTINSGQIVSSKLRDNLEVQAGDTLLVIDDHGIDQKLSLTQDQISESISFLDDLKLLLQNKTVGLHELTSAKYQKVVIQYNQKLRELQLRVRKESRDFTRSKQLYLKGVIAKVEYENKKFEYDMANAELHQFKKQQQTSWQTDLIQYNNNLQELLSSKEQLQESKAHYAITAPISGTLLNIKFQESGSFITTGSTIAEISPDTELLGECYVNPTDIGLISESNQVNFQVDAYNYNQWGLVTGEVIEIGNDIELLNDQPVFVVRCKLDQKSLSLKNGFTGNLKKGMTLSANFKLTERSLFDLLYDKMDDWLNPNRKSLAQL